MKALSTAAALLRTKVKELDNNDLLLFLDDLNELQETISDANILTKLRLKEYEAQAEIENRRSKITPVPFSVFKHVLTDAETRFEEKNKELEYGSGWLECDIRFLRSRLVDASNWMDSSNVEITKKKAIDMINFSLMIATRLYLLSGDIIHLSKLILKDDENDEANNGNEHR